ncbi:GNAT family N-acetyltransferase [Nannocystis radixulma]|uniref:GNAT family N-acetyltransferase n=1 Tax=Nannocystis radixulma TaxID=2995305 RepID=A0ABT5B9Q0_9BACT|nr:GNAT family N-acetyltransferase [Nannocystis radixulma]MDC0670869.1 GNAT family N-acetyltransferase [Nannocystis radixulma]
MPARLRAAGPADAADIFRLIVDLATYEREPDAVVVTVDELRAQLAAERPPFECLLAEDDDGAVVGFALYFHNYSTWRGRPGLYLEDLFVEPSRRGRGIGKQLLVRLAQLAVERGCARMEWAVLDWNTPAIGFYESLGARAVSEWTIFRLTGQELLQLAQST